jgi:hypothetical protein
MAMDRRQVHALVLQAAAIIDQLEDLKNRNLSAVDLESLHRLEAVLREVEEAAWRIDPSLYLIKQPDYQPTSRSCPRCGQPMNR